MGKDILGRTYCPAVEERLTGRLSSTRTSRETNVKETIPYPSHQEWPSSSYPRTPVSCIYNRLIPSPVQVQHSDSRKLRVAGPGAKITSVVPFLVQLVNQAVFVVPVPTPTVRRDGDGPVPPSAREKPCARGGRNDEDVLVAELVSKTTAYLPSHKKGSSLERTVRKLQMLDQRL